MTMPSFGWQNGGNLPGTVPGAPSPLVFLLPATRRILLIVSGFGVINRAAMKVRDVLKRIEKDGWKLDRTRGDHRQYAHPTKPGTVTIPGHP